jgi:hypothetical protein
MPRCLPYKRGFDAYGCFSHRRQIAFIKRYYTIQTARKIVPGTILRLIVVTRVSEPKIHPPVRVTGTRNDQLLQCRLPFH